MYYVIMSSQFPALPVTVLGLSAPSKFILSLAMDLKELETLLRKPAHTEEECARIVGSCNSLVYN
jgi:hypothetical protein